MSTIADIPGDPMNSLTDPTFTFHFDKYSCIREFYYAHVFFCYIIAISGANLPYSKLPRFSYFATAYPVLHVNHA